MSDISAHERRLRAAFDRIDQMLEAGAFQPMAAAPGDTAELDALRAENARLEAELADMHRAREAETAQLQDLMAELERLLAGGDMDGGASDDAASLPEAAGDDAGVPEEDRQTATFSGKEDI